MGGILSCLQTIPRPGTARASHLHNTSPTHQPRRLGCIGYRKVKGGGGWGVGSEGGGGQTRRQRRSWRPGKQLIVTVTVPSRCLRRVTVIQSERNDEDRTRRRNNKNKHPPPIPAPPPPPPSKRKKKVSLQVYSLGERGQKSFLR